MSEAAQRGLDRILLITPWDVLDGEGGESMATQRRPNDPILLRRQRYRLRSATKLQAVSMCPEWLSPEGVYEGDIDPSSQDFHEMRIRLFCPDDPELTFLIEEISLEEVD